MKLIVINADDYGMCDGRDSGILEAFAKGCVTSASLVCNLVDNCSSYCQSRAIERAVDASLPLGLHLNLTEGRPVSKGLRRLVGADGNFRGKFHFHHFTESDE